jgi:hypothetical protein
MCLYIYICMYVYIIKIYLYMGLYMTIFFRNVTWLKMFIHSNLVASLEWLIMKLVNAILERLTRLEA